MTIVSYNVNGIRAALRKGLAAWLHTVNADVVCLQEIKATQAQVAVAELEAAGYPFHYWYSAQKPGYSGVALLCKKKPQHVALGTGIAYMDMEGRNIRADFDDLSIMSLYLPSGTNTARLAYKLTYMADFQHYVDTLRKQHPNLIICGDYNVCHQAIDIHDPVRNKNVSGFLPVEREWMSSFMQSGFIDSFRHFTTEPHQYTWWSYRANARARNKGWRLDYGMVAHPLKARLQRSVILSEAKHSDHCPILLDVRA